MSFPAYDAVHSLVPASCSSVVCSLGSGVRSRFYRPDALIVLPIDQTLKESISRYMLYRAVGDLKLSVRRGDEDLLLLCFVSMNGRESVRRETVG